MSDNNEKHSSSKKVPESKDEIKELEIFIKKKKIQTKALKKIMAKLKTDEDQTTDK